jgi:hypothetical protein
MALVSTVSPEVLVSSMEDGGRSTTSTVQQFETERGPMSTCREEIMRPRGFELQ